MTSRSTTTSPKARSRPAGATRTGSGGEALCNYPFGARFGRLAGYRSFAFDGPGYGTRIVTNPLQPGGEDTTNMGSYLSLEGTTFQRMPGAGADNAPGGAFYTPHRRLAGRPRADNDRQQPQRLASWPVSARAPFTAVAPAPGTRRGTPRAGAGGRRRRRRRALHPRRAGSANSC